MPNEPFGNKYLIPENAGISSAAIAEYLDILEEYGVATHDVIIARGDSILFEKYWEPFHKDFLHRLYSVSKSFVSLAVGFAEQDGLLSLDDPMEKYFREELKGQKDIHMHRQTVRHMLMMAPAKPQDNWFSARPDDLVRHYFQNPNPVTMPSGTVFEYDSTGSFVLGALVERLCGMPFMEYLRIKLFDKIGVSKEAHCLTVPGGHSWGDSAILAKPTDLLKVARFVMNKGRWNGEQILNEAYVTAATSFQIDNNRTGVSACDTQGYGYLFWRTYDNSFFFNGMGCQFAVCVPDKDLILVHNGDGHQGDGRTKSVVIDNFFRLIARPAKDAPLPENPEAQALLRQERKLIAARGAACSDFQKKIDGAVFRMTENRMGLKWISLRFGEDGCRFEYENAQGRKTIPFGMCENVIGTFPEEGYSDKVGSVRTKNFYYRCAASAAWVEEKKLFLKVQIIDTYFGRLDITLAFRDENQVGVWMTKAAEDFLNEYYGYGGGEREM